MESQTESPMKKQEPSSKKNQDVGSVSKKKKERENRNSVSTNEFVHEWTQDHEFVIITIVVGNGHDNRTITVTTTEREVMLSFSDGRKLQINLYEQIVPDATYYSFKNVRCTIKLLKHDPQINWPCLESAKNPVPDKSSSVKSKGDSLNIPIKRENTDENMDESDNKEVVKVCNPTINFVERNEDPTFYIYLYITNIDKETFKVKFCSDRFTILFSTTDSYFLKDYTDANDNTVFDWTLQTKGEIVANQCSYRLSYAKIEIKLKKINTKLWQCPSLVPQLSDNLVLKNTWVPVVKNDIKKNSNIPPAPPAPPAFNEIKKPTSLISPSSKTLSNSSNICGFPISSHIGNDIGSGTSVCPRGMTGLDNIGNTCFMNSVLQCLVNTRELRDYFLEYNFQQDLNKDNPLGMGGKLAVSFAVLMTHLWAGTVRSFAPSKLKGVMSLKANQFSGFAQHDAQEFMVELLDGLHEDLNRIKKKPYIAEPPDLDGWTDHEAAEESWKLHKMRNDSIIDDLFKGQFKSTLRCHECQKISVKFDEFCCLSVPIPKDQKTLQVVFFWREKTKRPKKFTIKISADALVEDLKHQIATRTRVSVTAILVMETVKFKIHKIFVKGSSLSSIVPSDALMAFEVLTEQEAGERVVELAVTQRMMIPNPPNNCAACARPPAPGTKLKRCTKCYRVGYCDTSCQKTHWHNHKTSCKLVPEPVGSPFILSLPESAVTYTALSQMAENYARYSVDIFQPPVAQMQNTTTRRRNGSTSSGEVSSDAEEMEVDSEGSVEAKECELEGGSGAYSGEDRAEADWPLSGGGGPSSSLGGASCAEGRSPSKVHRSSSVSSNSSGAEEIPRLSSSPKGKVPTPQRTLTPATRLFTLRSVNMRAQNQAPPFSDTGSDPLDLRNVQYLAMDWCTNERLAVHCFVQNKDIDCEVEPEESVPRSRHTSLEACVDLFTQPENLSEGDSWRCPRCKKPVEATKQMSIWRLPSVLIIQLKRFSFKYVLYSDKIDKFVQYPIRNLDVGPFLSEGSPEGPAIYDLYGVINHMGRLLGGHYTAYCRTVDAVDTRQSEIDWRLCDDSRVNLLSSDSRVVHEQAYLLLYRRRGDSFQLHRPLPPSAPAPSATSATTSEPKDECEESVLSSDDDDDDDDDNEAKKTSAEPMAMDPPSCPPEGGGAKAAPAFPLPLPPPPPPPSEPMEEGTPVSLSSASSSQISSSSGSSDPPPPSTVQEELD